MHATIHARRLFAAVAVAGSLLAAGCSDDEEPNLGGIEEEGGEIGGELEEEGGELRGEIEEEGGELED